MKRLLLLTLGIILSISIYSQENRKGLIGVAVGPSFPLNNLANSYDIEGSGFALLGPHMNINFSYKFSKHFGIALLASSSYNLVDEYGLINYFRAINPTWNWDVTASDWSTDCILGGLLLSFPFNNRIDFDIKALYGFSNSSRPAITITAFGGNTTYSELQHDTDATAVALNFGTGFRIGIFKRMAISINLDYYYTNPTFEVYSTYNFSTAETYNYYQEMNMLNLSFGIGYRLK